MPSCRSAKAITIHDWRRSQTLNDGIDAFVGAALARNAPMSLINYPAGDYGFEILNDTHEARRVIAQSIAWVKSRLGLS